MTATHGTSESAWYLAAMERLVGVVQELSQARSVDAIAAIVRDAARKLTGADGATFVLRDGDRCYYADENAIAPLWKGRRFPMSTCISGWVMLNARPAVIEDIYADPRIPADAYRPTFVKSLAMVPIRRRAPIGAIGNYWAVHRRPADEEVAILQALADTTSVALENAELYGQLRAQVQVLQEQQARIQGQRDTLEVFTRALAHDLKEPVRSMRAFSQIVLERQGEPEQRQTYLEYIRTAADRMGALIDSVLRYIQADDPSGATVECCALGTVLQAVRESLAQLILERGAVILSGELPVVQASGALMTHVLQNLITNAIRHNERPTTIRVRAEARPDSWLLAVADDGRGVPPEHARRIFEPFTRLTNRQECTGLGLAVCDKIISRCGGAIWCESQPGHGATFYFTLPRAAGEALAPEAAPAAAAAAPPAVEPDLACLLLVDDRPDDLTLSRLMLLRGAGLQCRILTATGGEEALALLREERVDLMLLDINMPCVDGFAVLERLRAEPPSSPVTVIMCTGSDYEKDRERARELGAAGYLLKPPKFSALEPLLGRIPTLRLTRANGKCILHRVPSAAP